jgi:hypothetical protein
MSEKTARDNIFLCFASRKSVTDAVLSSQRLLN